MRKIASTAKSKELYEKSKQSLVNGVGSSTHKAPYEEYPIFMERGSGSRMYDVDGNEFIDYIGGLGPMILGYAPAAVGEAVMAQVAKGSHFAAPYPLLGEVSAKLATLIPCAERLAFRSTGTEANMMAFRLARAYTGKDKFIKFEGHYHGWSDEEMVSVSPDSLRMMGPRNRPWRLLGSGGQREGAISDVIVLPWNDLDAVAETVRRHGREIAAMIMEPIMCNAALILPKPGYLEGVKQITADNHIILIFDEVITGFRVALGGAQEYFGVTPDMSTFAKAVAGGYPLAGVAGRREVMESDVRHMGTFNANPIVIAACSATMKELEKPGTYERMAKITGDLTQGIGQIAEKKGVDLRCHGVVSVWEIIFGAQEPMYDARDTFKANRADYTRFRQLCFERGIRFGSGGKQFISAAHTERDVYETLEVVEEVLSEMSPHRDPVYVADNKSRTGA